MVLTIKVNPLEFYEGKAFKPLSDEFSDVGGLFAISSG